jgi:hypothetical protein
MGLGYADYQAVVSQLLHWLDEEFGDEICSIALFGSVARGTASATSDIDLLIVHQDDAPFVSDRFTTVVMRLRESEASKALEARGILADPYPLFLTLTRLKKHPWILLDIADHGLILRDRDGVLANELMAIRNRLKELGSVKVVLPDGTWYWDLKPDWKPGEVVEL